MPIIPDNQWADSNREGQWKTVCSIYQWSLHTDQTTEGKDDIVNQTTEGKDDIVNQTTEGKDNNVNQTTLR